MRLSFTPSPSNLNRVSLTYSPSPSNLIEIAPPPPHLLSLSYINCDCPSPSLSFFFNFNSLIVLSLPLPLPLPLLLFLFLFLFIVPLSILFSFENYFLKIKILDSSWDSLIGSMICPPPPLIGMTFDKVRWFVCSFFLSFFFIINF
jgi:hypothetical protein